MKVFLDTNILIDLGEHRENAWGWEAQESINPKAIDTI
jgi:hypothetical protein